MNNEVLLDILGNIIPEETQGILYLCEYNHNQKTLKVHRAIYFKEPYQALEAFANIPNPESQVAYKTKDKSFGEELKRLHEKMENPEWLRELGDCL